MGQPISILVVEDHKADKELITSWIKKADVASTITHVKGQDTFQKVFLETFPDIVISDDQLPDYSIFAAKKMVNNHDNNIPFILLTDDLSDENVEHLIENHEIIDCLPKNKLHKLPLLIRREFQYLELKREVEKKNKDLKNTKRKLDDILKFSTNLFYRHDSNHKLTYVSPQSEEFFGMTPEEAMVSWTELISDHPDNQKGLQYTDRAIKTGKVQPSYELELVRKDGSKIWVQVNEAPIVENGKTVAIVGSLTDITELKQSIREKSILIEEIHHRVNNNLAVITAFLELQLVTYQKETDARYLLKKTLSRVYSISSVHKLLFERQNIIEVDVRRYFSSLFEQVSSMLIDKEVEISLDISVESMNINELIPLGLLVNELLANSTKYAFDDDKTGFIKLRIEKDSSYKVLYEDNGPGMNHVNFDQAETLGFQIIKTLLNQLEAVYRICTKEGFKIELLFDERVKGAYGNM